MNRDRDRLEKYKIFLNVTLNEGHVLWSFSQAFLIANTIVFAFIAQRMTSNEFSREPDIWTFLLSIIGLLIALLWLFSYRRRSSYYEFRAAQLREIEPDDWGLIKGKGKDFSDGEEVMVDGKRYRLGIGGRLRTRTIITFFILLFVVLYSFLIWHSCPFDIKVKTNPGINVSRCLQLC